MTELANLGVLHIRRGESTGERAGKDARRPSYFGGILIRWPWIREARPMSEVILLASLAPQFLLHFLSQLFDKLCIA